MGTNTIRMDLVVCMTMLVVVAVSMGLPWVAQSLRNESEPTSAMKNNGSYQELCAVLPVCNG